MKRRKIYTQQMLTRVFDFGTSHAQLFPKDTVAGELLEGIGKAVSQLSSHSMEQASGYGSVRTSSISRAEARKALEIQLGLVDQTARALKLDEFYVPRNRSDSALINTAAVFANRAAELREQFVQHGLPASFVEDLKAAVQDLERAARDQSASKGKRKAAVEDFDHTLQQGLEYLERFDALVLNTLQDKPGALAEWNVARRVGHPPSRRRPQAPPSPPTQSDSVPIS